ncbi:hypothetical protein KAH94_03160 [bacterium]|nr:hypothetical protein [bacterium]
MPKVKKIKELKEIPFCFYKNKKSIDTLYISIETPLKQIWEFVKKNKPDLFIINGLLIVPTKNIFTEKDLIKYLPIKKKKKKRKKIKNPQLSPELRI